MATFYPKFYYKDSVGMAESKVKPEYHQRMIDFAVQNVTTSDTVNMLAVPAFTTVMFAGYRTIATVTSGSSTFVIGDGSAIYTPSAAAVAAGLYGVPQTIAATTTNVSYATSSNIQINTVATANLTIGQIQVYALMMYPQPLSYVDVDGLTHTYVYTDRNNWTTTAPVIA